MKLTLEQIRDLVFEALHDKTYYQAVFVDEKIKITEYKILTLKVDTWNGQVSVQVGCGGTTLIDIMRLSETEKDAVEKLKESLAKTTANKLSNIHDYKEELRKEKKEIPPCPSN